MDWPVVVADLEQLLKLRSIPFGMKLYESRAEMEAIPRVRRPQHVHTLDQLVGETMGTEHQLKRTLGPLQLTMLGVGAIVGAGIFSTVGTAAAGVEMPSPSSCE